MEFAVFHISTLLVNAKRYGTGALPCDGMRSLLGLWWDMDIREGWTMEWYNMRFGKWKHPAEDARQEGVIVVR